MVAVYHQGGGRLPAKNLYGSDKASIKIVALNKQHVGQLWTDMVFLQAQQQKEGEKRILNAKNESKKGGCNEERNMKVKSGEKIKCLGKKDNMQERHIGSWGNESDAGKDSLVM